MTDFITYQDETCNEAFYEKAKQLLRDSNADKQNEWLAEHDYNTPHLYSPELPSIEAPQEKEPEAPDLLKYRNWWGTDISGLLLDFEEPYTPPKWTLKYNGIPFAKRGDLHIVGGKSGHGKTNFMSQLAAALLGGRFGSLTCELEGQPRVLYIDTEQSKDDTISLKNRICTLAGMPCDVNSERFWMARLRETPKTEDRYKQILQLMWKINPDVVFIDGLLDIVNDYNDQKECADIIRDLMAYSTALNMSVWCVLHENPMTDKLVGSLGSIAERKVTDVFIIRKHKAPHSERRFQNMPSVFFEIKQTKARGKEMEDWYFVIEDRGVGFGVPIEFGTVAPKTSHTTTDLKKWIVKHQYDLEWPTTRTKFNEKVLAPEGVMAKEEVKELTEMAINSRFVLEQTPEEMEPGQRNPRLKLNHELINT